MLHKKGGELSSGAYHGWFKSVARRSQNAPDTDEPRELTPRELTVRVAVDACLLPDYATELFMR